jgi:pSer/pThr/pTyr-binding forkhead associated (FHA) protein
MEIEDLKSASGVWVNGQRVERAILLDGDWVRIGHAEFLVVTALPPKTRGPAQELGRWFSKERTRERTRVRGWLLVVGGGHTGQDFRLCDGLNRIGSLAGLEASLLDSDVAPVHCEIECVGDGIVFRKGQSSGELLVNGAAAVDGRTLQQGDVLKVGSAEIYLRCAP